MDLQKIRKASLLKAMRLGYDTNLSLPLMDNISLRSKEEIIGRSLALFSVVACSYGFNKESALVWIKNESIEDYLSQSEKDFIIDCDGDAQLFQHRVECLNAFSWVLGFTDSLDFDKVCDNTLIKKFPDIKNFNSSKEYQEKAKIRPLSEIVAACDLSYCLHWAISDETLKDNNSKKEVAPHVIIERRRTLEWILSSEDWDEISLDT